MTPDRLMVGAAILFLAPLACTGRTLRPTEATCGASTKRLIECIESSVKDVRGYELELEYQVQHNFPAGLHGSQEDGPKLVVLSRSKTKVRHRRPIDLVVRAEVTEEPLYEGMPSRSEQVVIADRTRMFGSVRQLTNEGSVISTERVSVEREKLARDERPYAAGLALPGTGFIPGLEFLGSLRYILSRYSPVGAPRIVDRDGERLIELDLERGAQNFVDELLAERQEMISQLVVARSLVETEGDHLRPEFEAMQRRIVGAVRSLRSARIAVAVSDFLPRRLELGADAAHPTHVITVKRFVPNPVLEDALFTSTSSGTRDLTPDLLRAKTAYEEAFREHPSAVKAVREGLLRALQSPSEAPGSVTP